MKSKSQIGAEITKILILFILFLIK